MKRRLVSATMLMTRARIVRDPVDELGGHVLGRGGDGGLELIGDGNTDTDVQWYSMSLG